MNYKSKIISIIAAVTLVSAALSGCTDKSNQTAVESEPPKSSDKYITASGVLEADNQYKVSTTVIADILSDPFEEGQTVKEGDVLYVLEQKDIQNNLSKARLAVEKAQLAYNQNADNIGKLSVKSNYSGTVTSVYVSNGDMVAASAKIADVIDDSSMKLTVPFLSDFASGIYTGQSATVSLVGTFYTLTGSVSKVSTGQLTTANGSNVKMVEIIVQNPGTLKKGDKATALIGDAACNDSGTFDYVSSGSVIAEVAGKVAKRNIYVGDRVSVGTVVTQLTNDTMTTAQEQYALGIKEAQLSLETLGNQLENYNITSKISGTVIKKNVSKNDTLSAANIGNLAIIADLSKIILKVNVDEMDVAKISVGNEVIVTADANPDKEYSGVVEFVSETGNNVNGVALYEVKIHIQDYEDLMPGMNVTAKFNF